MASGLFLGLITLDCIYQVERVPMRDEKQVAQDCLLSAGGPATNAAVAFHYLANTATVMGAMGRHPVTSLMRADLQAQGIEIHDLLPERDDPPPLSTILVTASTGERAVVSRNAAGRQASVEDLAADVDWLQSVDVLLIDGHQMAVSAHLAQQARAQGIPVVVDAGSWKLGFETVLPLATSVIASAQFRPPHCDTVQAAMNFLARLEIPEIAVTQGADPILWQQGGQSGRLAVPPVPVRDTLGAGDFFHGAFCHFRLQSSFQDALQQAAQVAAQSCRFFGSRAWLQTPMDEVARQI